MQSFLHCKYAVLMNQTKQYSFLLHFECFTLPLQPQLPGGTATKEVHLAQLLPGMNWPTLKPSLHNQHAELVWPSLTYHSASHHTLSLQTVMGGSTEGPRHSKACPRCLLVHSAEVMTPSVAESQAFQTHAWVQQATVVIWGTWRAVACLWPK